MTPAQTIKFDLLDATGTVRRSGGLVFPPRFHSGMTEEAGAVDTTGLPDGTYRLRISTSRGDRKEEEIRFVGQAYEAAKAQETERERTLRKRLAGMLGDYDSEPRTPAKRVDIPALIAHLKAISANTYDFLIWHQPTDWEDLQAFLPEADKAGIKVWVTLVPPIYNPPPAPFKNDYVAWAKAIAELSLKHRNLVAWAIDDFPGPVDTRFSPENMQKIVGTARKINPELGFFPITYSNRIRCSPEWIKDYAPSIDGIMYVLNLEAESASDMESELNDARLYLGPNKLLMVNVYGAGTGGHPVQPGVLYFRQGLRLSHELADGIRIYCLPKNPSDPLYLTAKELYGRWRGKP